jgi:hypothetical protein
MLQPKFKEGQSNEVLIEDFDASTVASFVRWLYLGELDSDEVATEVYFFAEKYLITDLKVTILTLLNLYNSISRTNASCSCQQP